MSTTDSIVLWIFVFVSGVLILILKNLLTQNNKKPLTKIFIVLFGLMLFWLTCMILQIIFLNKYDISLKYFFNLYYISICFLPIAFYFMAIIFENGRLDFKRYYLLLFIIPITSLLLLWTNDLHHLFYKEYSMSLSTAYGPWFYVHTYYTFLIFGISLFILMRYSIKNAGLFSRQAILLIIGSLAPIIVNLLGSTGLLPVSIYATPIAFSVTIICFTIGIFRFNLFKLTPIALQKIVDRMSDSYLVLNDDGTITDFNQTFLVTFKIKDIALRGQNFDTFCKNNKINYSKIKNAIIKTKDSKKTISFEFHARRIHKIFSVEVNTIYSDSVSLGTLILFKDITQHIEDMETIKNNQDILMERERLASLGQLIGGIAHNLKTPIMSISGAAEGLTDLVKEYDSSIDDPEVNSQDHHDIAKDMSEWIVKIKEYTEYMSDIITAVKGQAVTLSETENISFDIDELVKRVDILMKHELKNALIYMNVQMNAPKNTKINGDINSLVQVINNMISNAIQAYNGKTEQNIDLILNKSDGNLIISVRDYGCGLPQKVQEKLFKEMITTKGKNGTGLGLYMSYSTIKAHFNGNITFESKEGEGTTFSIILPL